MSSTRAAEIDGFLDSGKLKDWRNVRDAKGNEVSFTRESARAFLLSLPEAVYQGVLEQLGLVCAKCGTTGKVRYVRAHYSAEAAALVEKKATREADGSLWLPCPRCS